MIETKKFENYSFTIILLSNLAALIIYASGILVLANISWIIAVLYLIYILILELRLIKYHCVNCYYWGKYCGFGKGKLSSLLFKKGNPAMFCKKEMKWKEMLPDLMISLVPFVFGIVSLIVSFDFVILVALLLLILFSTTGNAVVRGKFTCKYCKQADLGCPAEQLFNKPKTNI